MNTDEDPVDENEGSVASEVQKQLECLNIASQEINELELALNEARAYFRWLLSTSTKQLQLLSVKLGKCIDKARPYYEARMKAREVHFETQRAALKFERACSQQAAAKEMVHLAEQGYFGEGQPFDSAWQEMLNHATDRVNQAEKERIESETVHQATAKIFSQIQANVQRLGKEQKRNIKKSRSYFEMKARYIDQMEAQKMKISTFEESVQRSKVAYATALRTLEAISNRIHQQRHDELVRQEMGKRESGVGAESASVGCEAGKLPEKDQYQITQKKSNAPLSLNLAQTFKVHPLEPDVYTPSMPVVSFLGDRSVAGAAAETPAVPHEVGKVAESSSELNSPGEYEVEAMTAETNANLMESLRKQSMKVSNTLVKKVYHQSRESLLDEGSDTDSVTGSLTSLSIIGDDIVDSLMMDTDQYAVFMLEQDKAAKTCSNLLSPDIILQQTGLSSQLQLNEAIVHPLNDESSCHLPVSLSCDQSTIKSSTPSSSAAAQGDECSVNVE